MAYSVIDKSSLHQNTKLYTGTGSSNAITGVGFQPDLVWVKGRSNVSEHSLFDVVRGVNQRIRSNSDGIETTAGNSVTSFDADGFTVVSHGDVNTNTHTYASWNWKAGGAGSSNTDGSITSTVSANTTAGFSIVKWTGTGSNATVGHGLGVAPRFIMMKNTSNTASWGVYHEGMGNDKRLFLDTTGGETAGNWQTTSPTSTVFSVDGGTITGGSGHVEIAYCFAEVAGYSKFGNYVGNGVDNGAFIYTGFKPSWVMVKNQASGNHHMMYDNKVIPHNLGDKLNRANENAVEVTSASGEMYDFLSNGFKARASSNNNTNYSGSTYNYMAFGQPIISNSGTPATAR